MDPQLKGLMEEYTAGVEAACQRLLAAVNAREHLNLRTKADFFDYRGRTRRMEFEADGIIFRLHGRGCLAFGPDLFLDWNFGYRSRWCGIDPWLLEMTLRKNNSMQAARYSGQLIKAACDQAVADGEMFEKHGLYYQSIPSGETFAPDFPADYDMLAVERFERSRSIPRSKITDRFLRKSPRIHKRIFDHADVYILRFYRDGREIYTIPYDDISYPENAVRIMSDVILRNLLENG